jgi:hypothetical protein
MKVFLSVGATYSEEQEKFVLAFEEFLIRNKCERLTVGRGSYTAKQPILQTRDLMQNADAVVVIAFTRILVVNAVDKPGSKGQKEITNARYPTVWNQIEASMAFGLKLPLLVILEDGLYQEAMLKDRLEFRVQPTPLDAGFFGTEEFKGVFEDFKQIAERRTAEKKPVDDIQVGLASALVAGAFWLGNHIK